MAAKAEQRSVRVKMTFPEQILGDPIIHSLSQECRVAPNIMRGRITEKSAWLEVELVGTTRNIERAFRYLDGRGVSVQRLSD